MASSPDTAFNGVILAGKPPDTRWDLYCRNGNLKSLKKCPEKEHNSNNDGNQFVIPGLCHPHIHLDKCFLLSHPKYADLEIKDGDFREAMELTSR